MISAATQTAVTRNVPVSSLVRAQFASGKVALPLRGGVYTSLEHVKGVPSRDDGGYSISKLQLIDIMVDRLVTLRSDNSLDVGSLTTESGPDAQIQQLATELADAFKRADVGVGTFAAGASESGIFLNLSA